MSNQPSIYLIWSGAISAVLILGWLINIFIRNLLAKDRDDRKETKQAITEFKNSFAEIIHDLRTTIEGAVFNLGSSVEEGHERAKTQLELSLSSKSTRRLNKIWDKYKRDTKKYYAKLSGHDPDSSSLWRKNFLSVINTMLKKVSKIT